MSDKAPGSGGLALRGALLALLLLCLLPLLAAFFFFLSGVLAAPAALLPEALREAPGTAKIIFALRAVASALLASFAYFALADRLASLVAGRGVAGRSRFESFQPWLFLGPACLLLAVFLVWPALETFRLSLTGDQPLLGPDGAVLLTEGGEERTEKGFVGAANYLRLFASEDFALAIRNSLLWLVVVPSAIIFFGMAAAVLADRIRWGSAAKSLIFIPLAISFVGAAVIWRNIYAAGGAGGYQAGLLNALLAPLGVEPRFWYEAEFWGNFFMMSILVWIQTGFAMVIFSAALRSVPEDTIEAARIDGAGPGQIFFRITLPQIRGTVVVVWTTLVILVLKVFDIPYALTANKPDKLLLATLMEQTRTVQREEELAAAVAIVLMLTIVPVMAFNVLRLRREARRG